MSLLFLCPLICWIGVAFCFIYTESPNKKKQSKNVPKAGSFQYTVVKDAIQDGYNWEVKQVFHKPSYEFTIITDEVPTFAWVLGNKTGVKGHADTEEQATDMACEAIAKLKYAQECENNKIKVVVE